MPLPVPRVSALGDVQVIRGDARAVPLPDASVDAVVTDPPYGLEFMGKEWDAPWKTGDGFRRSRNPADAERDNPFGRASRTSPEYVAGVGFQLWCEEWAREALRVLKPGGHLVAFGGTRTYHRMTCAIEDAGFEIRDSLHWIYGSGFPKSLDVSKAIDRAAGAEREVIGSKLGQAGYSLAPSRGANVYGGGIGGTGDPVAECSITAPATDAARTWSGWGTALKPAHEPIVLARKPLAGTVAANVTAHGTGALNIDACRVGTEARVNPPGSTKPRVAMGGGWREDALPTAAVGRWPSNLVLSHPATEDGTDACADGCVPECPVAELDRQSGPGVSRRAARGVGLTGSAVYGSGDLAFDTVRGHDDTGGASRFFPVFRYCAKAPSRERPRVDGVAHATVKPLALMSWLVTLVTPPGGLVLDPFAGTGTTLQAARDLGFAAVGVESAAEYLPLIEARLSGSGPEVRRAVAVDQGRGEAVEHGVQVGHHARPIGPTGPDLSGTG